MNREHINYKGPKLEMPPKLPWEDMQTTDHATQILG